MNKTTIEWVKNPDMTQGYTWNPITGCLNGCEYCYARKLANGRLKNFYKAIGPDGLPKGKVPDYVRGNDRLTIAATDPFYPRFWSERITEPMASRFDKKGKGMFVCDMSDLFGIGVPEEWTRQVFATIQCCPNHRFYLLTKQPQNLVRWSPFPNNCWVGVTATGYEPFNKALDYLKPIEAKVKYISVEPLLEAIPFYMERLAYCGINWIIIGAQTRPYKPPKIGWVQHIVEACDNAGIPVFLKDNLFIDHTLGELEYRQEMPD